MGRERPVKNVMSPREQFEQIKDTGNDATVEGEDRLIHAVFSDETGEMPILTLDDLEVDDDGGLGGDELSA